MKLRYELRDNNHPGWRGEHFTKLERAERALELAVGDPGRWSLVDRQTNEVLATK